MRFLVAGCGSIGRRHLGNLVRSGLATAVAGCDRDVSRRCQVQQEFGIQVFETLDQALDWRPSAVLLCTPTSLHAAMAVQILDGGIDLFLEKPIAADIADAKTIVERARSSGRVVLVACNMRFHPAVDRLRAILTEGHLGQPWVVTSHFSHYLPNWRPGVDYRNIYSSQSDSGGGIIMEGTHEIDYVSWISGGIMSVQCFGGRVSDLEIHAEDLAVLYCRLGNGAAAVIRLDYLRHEKSRGCEVIGSGGVVEWLSRGKAPENLLVRFYRLERREWETVLSINAYDPNAMYEKELKHFVRCIRGEEAPVSKPDDALRVLEIAVEARRQIELSAFA